MSIEILPLIETVAANSEDHVSDILKAANENQNPVYPIGGGTSLGFGLPAKTEGTGLSLGGLNKIIDYPARDMTITVQAGITLKELHDALGVESQQLPIDTPHMDKATLGGVVATNHSGQRRYLHGTMRDHVIGIRAVDGRGDAFAAGGRVVKNVAGYDFCKLLTGSMGTLGVITEVTLKLKPMPASGSWVLCQPRDLEHAELLLSKVVDSQTSPNLVELVMGPGWSELPSAEDDSDLHLILGFEGTETEVNWMSDQLATEWKEHDATATIVRDPDAANALYFQLTDFSADESAAMVVKLTGVPSGVTRSIAALQAIDSAVSIQSHAGNGVVIGKFAEYPGSITPLKAAAAASHGSATILSNPSGAEMTHHNVWGAADVPFDVMKRVKAAFDPNNILNPGRFVY